MTQQYFVTVKTMGPRNINKSTKELCGEIVHKLDNTIIKSLADIDKVYEYLRKRCDYVNAVNYRARAIYADEPRTNFNSNKYICVRLSGNTGIDNILLKLEFIPVRHSYQGVLLAELKGDPSIKDERPSYKTWNYENAKDGDIIVFESYDESYQEIIIYRRLRGLYIVPYVCWNQEEGMIVQENDIITIGGRVTCNVFHYATEEEKGILFNEMSVRGLRWNAETLTVEEIKD